MRLVYTVTIPGRAYVKKNGAKVFGHKLVYTPQYQGWKQTARLYIKTQGKFFSNAELPFRGRLRLQAVFFFTDRRSEPDLSALYEGVQDELQAMQIIENDKHIVSHDGSTKVFGHPEQRVEVSLFSIG